MKENNFYISGWKAIILMIVSATLGGIISVAVLLYTDIIPLNNSENIIINESSTLDLNDMPDISAVAVSVAEAVKPTVVNIDSMGVYDLPYFSSNTEDEVQIGSGSGVIYSTNGYIITNYHVIEGSTSLTVTLDDGSIYDAEVIGADERTDLAIIKIDASNLIAATIGNSDTLQVGEFAMAVGNPGGSAFAGTVTQGSISGLNRTLTTEDGYTYELVQTDAAINPGNSGGALVNASGELIGINTIKISDTNYEGMGFAIPINTVVEICDELITNGYIERPAMGVSLITEITPELAEYNNLSVENGVLIYTIEDGAADIAGMQNYDIITAIEDETITGFSQLQDIILNYNTGDTINVTVQRGKESLNLEVKLGILN